MWGPMCAMLLTSYGWDLRNIAKIDQGTANLPIVNFFSFFKHCQRLERNFLQPFYTIWATFVCNETKIARLGFMKQPKLTMEQPFVNFFQLCQKQSTRFERKFLQSF